MKKVLASFLFASMVGVPAISNALVITGGDAADQASADDVLDIIFLIDTSGSMYDDINAIGSVAQSTIKNLQCPECDVYVRATFAGINGTYGGTFNQAFTGNPGDDHVDSSEDNGGAALDAINMAEGSWWTNDATVDQDYYRAVVTIGDEGTENGQPVYSSDYDIAYLANQAAIAKNVFLFSWVTNDPYSGVVDLFKTMALGGTYGSYTFGYAGGGFVNDAAGTGDVAETLEDIICTAGSGGGNQIPEPTTMLLFGTGLAGLAAVSRKKRTN